MKFLFILACALTTACSAADAGWKMFDRRVGMFVHWGVYASLGYHEQARMRLFMPRDEYAKKALPGFTADKFRGDDLVDAAESLGAEYIVVTTKHHDGFCLWDTKATDFNAVNSPAKRDLIKELADACHRRGMKLGFYYSNPDWHHPNAYNKLSSHQTPPEAGDVPDMEKYKAFVRQQITELLSNYGEICCLFWDIPTRIEAPEMNELVRRLQPGIRINDRGWGSAGDYSTPERDLPAGKAFRRPTEACDSVGARSWGYRANEDYRTVSYCTRSIDHFLSLGGNFLLNVGPKADGTVPDEARTLLKKTGDWYRRVREAFRDVTTVETDVKADDPTVMTRRGNTVYVHCPKGLAQTGLDLRAIRILPQKAVVLNDGAPVSCDLDVIPHNYESRQRTLHLGNLAADRYANEAVVIRLDFAEEPLCGAAVVADGTDVVIPAGNGGVERSLREAAETLARAYAEATGGKLRVVTAERHDPAAKAVFLGRAAAEKAGFDLAGFKAMENVVAEKGGSVYLFGNDRLGHKGATGWQFCVLPSVRALTRFMEGRMNVRFLMPGDVGMDVAKVGRVELPAGTYDRELPKLEIGNGRFHGMMYDIANNIFGNGACHTYGGHTYPSACPVEKYYAEHPEYFALRSGKRVGVKGNPALCISNPAVEDLVVAEILKRFDNGSDIVELGQNDGLDYCQCEKCAALGKGLGFGEQFWVFHRRVAERLYRLRPDKKVQIIAYSVTSDPPKTFKGFPPNVMVEIMRYSRGELDRWNAFGVPHGFSTYIYHWGEYPQPGLSAKRTFAFCADSARTFIECGVKGVYRCGYGELFGTEGPAYYVFNRLLGDPTLNETKLVDEYCRRAYGPAAKPMLAFFRTLDDRLKLFCSKSFGPNAVELLAALYTPDALAALESSLSAAERLAETPKQKQRLALTRMEFDYAKSLGTIAHGYFAYRLQPTEANFRPLADAILARNAFIDGLYDAKGRIRPIAGWPEILPFGSFSKRMMMTNGRLGATLSTPYGWDVASMLKKGILPGSARKSLEAVRAAARPTMAEFKAGGGAWAKAAWQSLGGIQLEDVSTTTRFKVVYDAENLSVGVEADMPDDYAVKPLGRDCKPWLQDDLEVMVDPTGFAARWYHFMWNAVANSCAEQATGLIEDPLDPKYGQADEEWNGAWDYENDRANGTWRSILVVPFKTLGVTTPAPGETWTMNVGRETPPRASDKPNSHDLQLSLWNPNLESRSFVSSAAFGTVVFK